ncbi:ESX secretion-associated protein EspG [Amycolatopsis anabasis]|uniref:ESX secretion-associated protein EspG n=1 Tax=Amycolatopsis anabasis TaxID=1840409 RepID=UPI00131CFCFF|nr:ESX secretion-associated protein EspG [Amycolatopsis anabasis]
MRLLNREVVLSQDCLDVVANWIRVTLPPTLAPEPIWRSGEELRTRDERARAELAEHGLLRGASPAEEFTEALSVLCRGGTEFFAYVESDNNEYRLHAAASGQDAIFACYVPASGNVLLRSARSEALVEELVAELPEFRPGQGVSHSVPERELRGAVAGKPVSREVRRVLDLLDLPRHGGGQVSAGVRDGLGAHRTSRGSSCTYLDTEAGRWLFSFTEQPGGERYVNIAPARFDLVVGKTYELGAGLRHAR